MPRICHVKEGRLRKVERCRRTQKRESKRMGRNSFTILVYCKRFSAVQCFCVFVLLISKEMIKLEEREGTPL